MQQPEQTIIFVAEELHQAEMRMLTVKQNVSAAEFALQNANKRVEQLRRVLEALSEKGVRDATA